MRNINGYKYDSLPVLIKTIIRRREHDWQNWNDEQIVIWIYTELGKQYSMDPNYRYGDEKTKLKIEKDADNMYNFNHRLSRRNVTCIDLANALEIVLNDVFGIECKARIDGSGPHQYNIVKLGKKRIKLDLQEDLVNIQSGRRLEHFGQTDFYDGKNFNKIDQEKIDNLLTSIKYTGIPYKNQKLESYAKQLEDKNIPLIKKLEIALLATSVEYFNELSKMEYCERVELFKKSIADCIYSHDNTNTRHFRKDDEISHRTAKKNNKYISCFSVKLSNSKKAYYINDGSDLKYKLVSEKEYKELFGNIDNTPNFPDEPGE